MPGQDRGKSYAEWDAHRKGTSWKAKLKVAIDAVIPQAKDFDDFLRLLQEQGYEVKRGKYVSFRAPGQERFTRCKTLGEVYTEETIIERIKGRFVERKPKENRKISLRIDLENSIKVQQSAGYEKWEKLHNLKQAARTLNFLTEHEIDSYPDLESRVAEITAASTEAAAALKAAERRLAEMAVLIKDVTTCKELHPLLQEYQRAADKKQFRCRRFVQGGRGRKTPEANVWQKIFGRHPFSSFCRFCRLIFKKSWVNITFVQILSAFLLQIHK